MAKFKSDAHEEETQDTTVMCVVRGERKPSKAAS